MHRAGPDLLLLCAAPWRLQAQWRASMTRQLRSSLINSVSVGQVAVLIESYDGSFVITVCTFTFLSTSTQYSCVQLQALNASALNVQARFAACKCLS